jgi:hypothetical protein
VVEDSGVSGDVRRLPEGFTQFLPFVEALCQEFGDGNVAWKILSQRTPHDHFAVIVTNRKTGDALRRDGFMFPVHAVTPDLIDVPRVVARLRDHVGR